MSRILIADDEHSICQAFAQMVRLEGHSPLIAANGRDALRMVEEERPDAVFLDVRMPGLDGIEVLKAIRERHLEVPVVVMTAFGTMQTAMEAMRLGAFDYLGKPLELAQVRKVLQRALHRPEPETAPPSEFPGPTDGAPVLIGQSAAMQQLYKLMVLLTENDLTVLVLGESGVGKELVAQGIHYHSKRRDQPFVAVNCAAIPENLLESELFGHERGAFTGANDRRVGRLESAGSGTLFLDEIGDLPLALQAKLLRVLQEHSFERLGSNQAIALGARIITATNRDLEQSVRAGAFREDLFHRLNLVTLRLPPLRARREDIPLLAAHFLGQANRELHRHLTGIEQTALERLQAYHWPGNVRELEHQIKRSALAARGTALSVHDLTLPPVATSPRDSLESGGTGRSVGPGLPDAARAALREALRESTPDAPAGDLFATLIARVEQALVDEALRITDQNQVAAARLLGLHRTTLRKKMATPDPPDPSGEPSGGPRHSD